MSYTKGPFKAVHEEEFLKNSAGKVIRKLRDVYYVLSVPEGIVVAFCNDPADTEAWENAQRIASALNRMDGHD